MTQNNKQLGEPSEAKGYVEHMNLLIDYCHGVALGLDPVENMKKQVVNGDELWRQITHFVPGGGFSSSMAGRYRKKFGTKGALTGPVEDKTHLSLAFYLWFRVKGRWGPTKQDAWKSLCCWLYYGPDANPADMPGNWAALCNWPPLEKVEVDVSKEVKEIKAALPTLSRLEKIAVIGAYTEDVRLSIEYELMGVGPAPEPEPEETPCDEDNPVCHYLGVVMHLDSPLTPEAIGQVADKVGLSVDRARAVLCGDEPTADEHEQIAAATGTSLERYQVFIESLAATIAARKAQS